MVRAASPSSGVRKGARSPRGSRGDRVPGSDRLQAFLHSDAMRAWLHCGAGQQKHSRQKRHLSTSRARQLAAAFGDPHAYTTHGQTPGVPSTSVISDHTQALPAWMSALTWDVRQTIEVAAFDCLSDPAQSPGPSVQALAPGRADVRGGMDLTSERPSTTPCGRIRRSRAGVVTTYRWPSGQPVAVRFAIPGSPRCRH